MAPLLLVRRGAPLLAAATLASACGGGESVTFSPEAVQEAFRGERLVLTRPNPHLDDAYVHLQWDELSVEVFPSVEKANEWAPLLHQQVGWGTLTQPRPMHRTANVVVYYDPAFTNDRLEARVRRAMRTLAQYED
jgi:hypothetical protein